LHGALSKCISAEKQQHLAGVIVINKELSFAFIRNKKGPNKRGKMKSGEEEQHLP